MAFVYYFAQQKRRNMRYVLLLAYLLTAGIGMAQDIMLQAWYWDYPRVTPYGFYAQQLATQADAMAEAGFNWIWLPPTAKGSGGQSSIGYDTKDYYDLGDFGIARYGARRHFDWLMDSLALFNLQPVVDVVYNHRDGGAPEDNPALETYIETLDYTAVDNGANAFPSDRYRCFLPIGGTTGNGAGDYYFKVRSQTQHPRFFGKPYVLTMWTNTIPVGNSAALSESEPNGGGDCGEPFDNYVLGRGIKASVDNGGCGIDEFKLTLTTRDFNPAGDTLWLSLMNEGAAGFGDYSDHFVRGLWHATAAKDIQDQIVYQSYTDFTNMPSGKGAMNWQNFRPNGNPTNLAGDWDGMWFFKDIDQNTPSTRDVLFEWSRWLYQDAGFKGFRVDAVKHFPPDFMGDLLDYLHDEGVDPGMVVGEYFDGNPGTLAWWVNAVKGAMDQDTRDNINIRVFDFPLRQALKNACDAFGYDVRNVFNAAMADGNGLSGFDVVTFLNNHDFRYPGEEVINDPALAYAYLLTNNQLGIPCVFYPDYFDNRALAADIKALIEVHKRYIFGASQRYYLNNFGAGYNRNFISGFENTSLIYQLSGAQSGRNVIVAINFAGETLRVDQGIEMNGIMSGDTLTDILGTSGFPYAIVNGSNQVYLEVPARSYAIWVQGDLRKDLIAIEDPFVSVRPLTSETDVRLFPNPATNQLQVQFATPWTGSIAVSIFNIQGQRLQQLAWNGDGTLATLSTTLLPPGMYLLQLQQGDKQATLPFMKM